MNYVNPFKAALLSLVLCACTKREEAMMLVTPEKYASEDCWGDEQGNFSSLMVLAQRGKVATPYVVSAKCFVDEDYSSYGEGVLHHLDAVLLIDTSGQLQQAIPGLSISDNVRSHQPMPASDAKLYYLRAKAARAAVSSRPSYEVGRVEELRDTGMSFEQFLSLPQKDRENMLMPLRAPPL